MKSIIISIFIASTLFFTSATACDQSASTLTGIVQNGNGTYTLTFEVCFAGSAASQGDSHGFYITVNGATIQSVSPTSITRGSTVTSSISGSTATWGPWNDNSSPCFVCTTHARICYSVSVTTDVRPTGYTVGGQEYAPPPPGPSASWCRSTGAVPLSVDLQSFYAKQTSSANIIYWLAEEKNNREFILERSKDLENWEQISVIGGCVYSGQATLYSFEDKTFNEGTNYYRVKDVDFNGNATNSFAIAVVNSKIRLKLLKTYNFMGIAVDDNYKGYVIEVYEDGSTVKRFRE